MARLRNRIRKSDYFSDGELLRWHRDKRATYSGLYALAEDSGCLPDDPFEWKMLLWPSPLDTDITVEVLEGWRDEFVAAGKLIPYEAGGERYFYLRSFHKHEHPRNPQSPTLPTPPWVTWTPSGDGSKARYEVCTEAIPSPNNSRTELKLSPNPSVRGTDGNQNSPPAQPSPVQPSPVQSLQAFVGADAPTGEVDHTDWQRDFEGWWADYGRVGHKCEARPLYLWWREQGATRETLDIASRRYREHCTATDCKLVHARTFLAKKPNRWREWADGEAHGSMDVAATTHLSDVLTAGAAAFGLTGGSNGNGAGALERRRSARVAASGQDAGSGLAKGQLESGL